MNHILTLCDINKSFGSLQVLRHVSLQVGESEILAIVGPSGAGKSTLLRIAGTLETPDSGSVLYADTDVSRLNDRRLSRFRNANIGFIFQSHRLLPEFTALENVMMPALIGGTSRRHARDRAERLLSMLGLEARSGHRPSQMSGGECQRVAVARALVNEPRIVLADEPTGSLDTANRRELHALMCRLREELGQTFVVVTHDDTLAATADRTITLTDGQII